MQSPSDYLEYVLKELKLSARNAGYEVKYMNEMRSCIKGNFPQRSCHALPIPSADDNIVRNLSNVPDTSLNPAFAQVGCPMLATTC